MLGYPWQPHKTIIPTSVGSDGSMIREASATLEEANAKIEQFIHTVIHQFLTAQINDVIHLSVQNALQHSTNTETRALATARIPAAVDHNDTLRFLIAFLYEKQVGYPKLTGLHNIRNVGGDTPYEYTVQTHNIALEINQWSNTANRIVVLMEDASDAIGTLSTDADFIRTAALVDTGVQTGISMSTSGNTVTFGVPTAAGDAGQMRTFHSLKPNKTFSIGQLDDVRFPTRKENETDTFTITAKTGPSLIRVRSHLADTYTVLAKDASRTFTLEEMRATITSQPILVPTANRELPAVTDLEVGSDESVDIANLFRGLRVVVTAASGDDAIVTTRVNTGATSMGITGVKIGNTTVTVTGTNEAGEVSVTFNVTVIAASEE